MWLRFWNLLERAVFGDYSNGPGILPALVRALRYPYAVIRDLAQGQINLRAMGLVYNTLLAIVPLLAFSFAVLKGFGAHRNLEWIVHEFFRPVGAGADEITRDVMRFADGVSSGILGSVGFALLLWTLLGTIQKVEESFNYLWRVEQPRSFARRVTEYLTLLIVGPLLLVAFIGLSHAAMQTTAMRLLVEVPLLQVTREVALQLSPFFMVMAIFTLLYMFIPNTRVSFRPALIGGVTAGVLWAAVGKIFTALVVATTRLQIVYAGFAIIVAALLWTYFGWLILLIGAQLSFYLQNPNYLRIGLTELRLSSSDVEQLAFNVMYLVAKGHAEGDTRWSSNSIAAELGLPGVAVSRIVKMLERGGLLVATDDDRLLPARDAGHIQLRDILDIARNERSSKLAIPAARVPAVARLGNRLEEAWRACCDGRTLRDLIEGAV